MMMPRFFVRQADYQKNPMLNICDEDLLGKNIQENDLSLHISKNYYGDRVVEQEEAKELLQKSNIINMVGRKAVSLSISLGIGTEKGVKVIDGVPFLIVFKM